MPTLTKKATLNWPTHRGTATAFPLAAFGLSAFFYTLIAGIAFPGDTSGFLLLLSLATSLLVLVSIPFLHVVDHHPGTSYAVLPTTERTRRDSNLLHRTKSNGSKYSSTSMPQTEPSKHCISLPCLSRPLSAANCHKQTMTNKTVIQTKILHFCRYLGISLNLRTTPEVIQHSAHIG